MAYFNDNLNFYSMSTAPEEFELYPSLQRQTSATTEEDYGQVTHTIACGWSTVDQPGYSAVASTSVLAASIYESTSSTLDSYPTTLDGSHWPQTSQSTEPDHPGVWNPDDFLAGGQGWETTEPNFNYNPAPTDSWGYQEFGKLNDVSYTDDIPNNHQTMAGETGTGMMDSQWFQPYGTHRAMYGNAEAGPSTQPPPPIPYGVWQTAQSTGGTSETAANAETNKTFTEEDETPAPRKRRPNGEGVARPHREKNRRDVMKLRTWAKGARGSKELPTYQEAITTAAGIITLFRKPVYHEDRLFKGHGRRTSAGDKEADEEYERRNETRQVYQTLSRCYHLEGGRRTWRAPQLLSKVLEDLDTLYDILRN